MTKQIMLEIEQDARKLTNIIKGHAPRNSRYQSNDNGRLVDYIYVEGKRVRSNTNRLYESITFRNENLGTNQTTFSTVVQGDIPYYEEAVLTPTIRYARHFGRSEYGSIRYGSNSIEYDKPNRNYLFYMKAESAMLDIVSKWNGKVYHSKESIGDYK